MAKATEEARQRMSDATVGEFLTLLLQNEWFPDFKNETHEDLADLHEIRSSLVSTTRILPEAQA